MPNYPTPVKIAAGPLHAALRLQNVLTIETVEAALHDVYKLWLWEARGMFGHDDDLDLACEIIEDAGRLVREWEQRKRAAADPTPTSVRVHESNAEFAAHMLTALRDSATAIDRRTEAGL